MEKYEKEDERLEMLTQIQHEIEYGLSAVEQKREIFRERLHKYIEPSKEEDKISDNTLYATTQLFCAVNYEDKLSAMFVPRRFWSEEYAENVTDLAKYDEDEMNLWPINFQKYWDMFMFGVWIRVLSWWDDVKKCPKRTIKDPLSWIPDPYGNHIDKFRFHYFEEQLLKDEMTEERWFIKSEVEQIGYEENPETRNTINFKNQNQGLNNVSEEQLTENRLCNIYNGFTYYDGKRYLVTVDESKKLLLRFQEIKPVKKEEKENPELIEVPVVISWFSPYRWDPFGVSWADLVEDKQTANQILKNLRLIDAKFLTFWQTNLYDPRAIKNRNDLTKPSVNTKWISFDSTSWVPISNAVYPVPRQSIMNDSFNVSSELRNDIQLATWMDNRTLWVPGDKTTTLWEAQQIQANANVRLWLNVEINNWAEKQFWKIWYRTYQEYFDYADTKLVRIANGFWISNIEFRRDDFIGWEDLDIVIESRKYVEQLREKQKISFMAKLPLLLQDPNIPTISKKIALRYSLKLDWMQKDYINVMVPPTTDELSAQQKISLINNEDNDGALIDNMDEDHYTYLILFEKARENSVKQKAIENRKQAIMMSWQNIALEQEWWAVGWQANAMAAQMWSAAIQQWSSVNSLQNI